MIFHLNARDTNAPAPRGFNRCVVSDTCINVNALNGPLCSRAAVMERKDRCVWVCRLFCMRFRMDGYQLTCCRGLMTVKHTVDQISALTNNVLIEPLITHKPASRLTHAPQTQHLPAPEKSNSLKSNQIELLEVQWNGKKDSRRCKISISKI